MVVVQEIPEVAKLGYYLDYHIVVSVPIPYRKLQKLIAPQLLQDIDKKEEMW